MSESKVIFTKHAKERFYQRIISGIKEKNEIEDTITICWRNAINIGSGKRNTTMWKSVTPYWALFITIPSSDDENTLIVLTVLDDKFFSTHSPIYLKSVLDANSIFSIGLEELVKKAPIDVRFSEMENLKQLKKILRIEADILSKNLLLLRESRSKYASRIKVLEGLLQRVLINEEMGFTNEKLVPLITDALNDSSMEQKHDIIKNPIDEEIDNIVDAQEI